MKECHINSSTQSINDNLKSISVENDEELVSFDIVSLYTNVPVHEPIHHCADLLYNNDNELPPVSKETLIELATMSNCNVWMLTPDGFYRQKDELAMGSPPAPNLANGWLSQFDHVINPLNARIFTVFGHSLLEDRVLLKKSWVVKLLGTCKEL